MQTIPIQPLPNQSFSVILDANQWDWTIEVVNEGVAVTLALNGTVIISGLNIAAGARIIPAEYEEAGNFVLVTMNYQIPNYTLFGTGQKLVYLNATELDSVRVPAPPILTAAYFDPNAALPLRIFPQGYTMASHYIAESPSNYVNEAGTNNYVDESGANNYVSENNPYYITEDGLGYYFTEGGS